jgi:hypothetical protein
LYGKDSSQPNSTAVTTGLGSVQELRKQTLNNRPFRLVDIVNIPCGSSPEFIMADK